MQSFGFTCKSRYSLAMRKIQNTKQMELILSEILSQNKAKGFTAHCETPNLRHFYVRYAQNELMKHFAKLATISLTNTNLNCREYFSEGNTMQ